MKWQLQEAKQQFSEVVRRALQDGPQVVTRHGKEVVVIVSVEEYRRLRSAVPDFKAFLLTAPDLDSLEIERDRTPPREIDLAD